MAENIFGADLKPNGKLSLRTGLPPSSYPDRCLRSLGLLVMHYYRVVETASFTVTYRIEYK